MSQPLTLEARIVNRGKAMRALADVIPPGGHVVWLDTAWPMHRQGPVALLRLHHRRAVDESPRARAEPLRERKAA